ncbi:acyl-coenzyme A thioesterase 3-like [Diretmus argenteus]
MNSAVVIFLDQVDKVNDVVECGITIKDLHVPVVPLSQPSTRVTLSNVPPFISDEFLSRELSRHGKLVSPIKKVLTGLKNLPPGLPVTLHSLHHTDDKDTLEAYGHYISDDRGTVTVSDDASIGGTYTGKEPMGLLWSMLPVPGSRPGISWRKKEAHTPMVVFISVYRGHVVEGFNEQPPMASVVTERWYMAPGVQRIDIEERGVRGTLFLPPGPGPFPGLLNLLGARGLTESRGALLASHGFASLVVEYLTPDKSWKTDFDLDYFETAFNILQEHPLVINDRVGVFSFSFGGLVTFSMAAYSKIATITKMMRAAGNEHLLNTLTYPNAGHLIEPPYKPHCRASHYIQWNTRTKVFMLWGGQAKPHADAEEDSWMKILAFLRQHLQPDPNVIPPDNKQ